MFYNLEPAKLDDRELGCIDSFLFCFLLSSGLVWPRSRAIMASSWTMLASSWTILAPSGAIWAPSWAPKASPSFPRLNQTIPRGAQRRPEAPRGSQSQKRKSGLIAWRQFFASATSEIHLEKEGDSPLAKSILRRYELFL